MTIHEVLRLALESLVANKLRALLTMLGMIIGVGAVVLLVSIGNGAKNYVTGEFQSLGSNFIAIHPGKKDSKQSFGPPIGQSNRRFTLADTDALQKKAFYLDAVSPLMFGMAKAKNDLGSMSVTLLGVNEQFYRIFNFALAEGDFFSKEESDNARRVTVIGDTIARELFPKGQILGQKILINENEHRVIGILKDAGEKLGLNIDEMVMVPTRSAMRILNDDKLFGIRAKANSKTSLDDAVAEISDLLKERRNGEEDFTIMTQASLVQTMETILNMLTYVLGGIAMISMLVGGIGIMNIMLVTVTERTREIGIRRAVGARQSDIMKQFFVEAIVLSVSGGLVGLIGSVLLTYLFYFLLPSFDMRAPFWILPPAFLLSALIGVFFGSWPARKASRISTIEALRYE
jgi:putative ABC transport system permease protein